MNEDLYGLQASGIDPAIAAQLIPLQRQRMVYDAMLKQSMETPQVERGTTVHPLQGIAKLVQAYMAQKGYGDIETKQRELALANEKAGTEAMGKYESLRNGSEPIQPLTKFDDEGNQMPVTQAVKGDPRAAVAMAMTNPLLRSNPVVKSDVAAMQKAAEPYSLREGEKRFLGDKVVSANQKQQTPLVKEVGMPNNQVQQQVSRDGGITWTPVGQPTDKFNPKAGVQVSVTNAAEKAGAVELAKNDAKIVQDLKEKAIAAANLDQTLARMSRAVEGDKTTNGMGGEVVTALQNAAVTLGDKSLASRASSNEAYIADVANLIRDKIKALGSGTAISNTDLLFTKQSMPDLVKTREGKRQIIDAMRKDAAHIQSLAKNADAMYRKNKGSLEGFDYGAPKTEEFRIVE